MMSGAVTAIAVGALAVSAYSSHQQASAQKKAQNQAVAQAEKQQKQAEREFNRANQKKPDLAGIMQNNRRAGEAGSTMLTGSQGVDPGGLSLGKSTLLGQ